MADDDSLLVEKITISGATLASILQRFSSSPGDVDGLLFGHFTRLPPPDPNDDDPSSSYSSSAAAAAAAGSTALGPFAASITGHFSSGAPMSFYDSVGRIDLSSLRRASEEDRLPILLGWFCGRRRTPLRPSMRELAVSNSLFETLTLTSAVDPAPPRPCVFLLLSFSSTENQAIHTHEYRAFHLRRTPPVGSGVLEPRSLRVVNIGLDFRGQYGSFCPDSALPWMSVRAEDELGRKEESLGSLQDKAAAQLLLDSAAEGFAVERLGHLVGPGVTEYASELEDLYRKMLLKLEGLARLVEKSSARVLEQENKNLKIRCRLAGLE